jgi:hypothetical protein
MDKLDKWFNSRYGLDGLRTKTSENTFRSIRKYLQKRGYRLAADRKGLILTDDKSDSAHQPDFFASINGVRINMSQIEGQIQNQIIIPAKEITDMSQRANFTLSKMNEFIRELYDKMSNTVCRSVGMSKELLSIQLVITSVSSPHQLPFNSGADTKIEA